MGLKIGPIRPKRNTAETGRRGGGVGLKIGPMKPKRGNAEVTEEGG